MKTTDFAKYLTSFLGQYLPVECGVSKNTITTYSYTFTLLIQYFSTVENIAPEHLTLETLTYQRITGFLDWIESERKCSIATRNARLGCLHSFFNYLQYNNVQGLAQWQRLRSIKSKRIYRVLSLYVRLLFHFCLFQTLFRNQVVLQILLYP